MDASSAPGGRDDFDSDSDSGRARAPSPDVDFVPGRHHDDDELTRQYLDFVLTLHREWAELEEQGDASVQLSRSTRAALSEAVRTDARRGAQVEMPPTDLGPFTLTELALRTLIREAVDGIAGVMSLRSVVDYAPAPGWGTRGVPTGITCRISASALCPDLPALAESVRRAVAEAFERDLDLSDLVIDIHIEDLHDS